ncbi:MAG: CDP-2,3-bis-(O-geranylgeranyl)-sn-glycerol synthase [Candidatus ainarchaeum sp.]|nr:CDP-2,3-bis-(O-geranylgeranyl)-sn-glycerol synthase [Candidatus ainarchaeum sp.]
MFENLIGLIFLLFSYVIPMYIANSSPVIIHGKTPIDFGKNFKGKRILGNGKSIVGAIAGIFCGTIAGLVFSLIFPSIFIVIPNYLFFAFILSIGAISGDIIKSFFKRRMGIESGKEWIIADQLDFVVGAIALSLIIRIPEWQIIVCLLIFTLIIHRLTNYLAFNLKLKNVPW